MVGEKIFEEWRVYEKLLIHDYMDHRSFFGGLQQYVTSHYHQPISILDLGCGDLTPILPLLQAVPLAHYTGIDESAGALDIAAKNLLALGISGNLVNGDLLLELEALEQKFDLVVASFSLHHLADPAHKLRTLQAIESHLNSGGIFALIDVFCQDGEPRNEYIERWISHADQRYESLLAEEKQLLFDHVRARDYPVSQNHWRSLAAQSGLGDFRVMLQDSVELNGLVGMMRPG
ncbi:MAG TPA: class I SAM-dependent methyltransferase [Xanthomonadales bacterium]|nr:class I SAM-dependent methyltransferase [Xanthomonadales bacterium]